MPEYIRALVIIIILASLFFWLVRQPSYEIITPDRFSRWKNLWLGLTCLAFLGYSYWIYAFVAGITFWIQNKKENNTLALFFFLLFLIPPIPAEIPGFGLVNYFFTLNHPRLLALCLLLPSALALRQYSSNPRFGSLWADKFLFGYLFLTVVLELRDTTFTDTIRTALYAWTDAFLPYYVASRSLKNLRQFREAMAGFLLATLLLAVIGVFEFARHWLLYGPLTTALNVDWALTNYLGRAEMLRAVATTGQAIVLGYVMAAAIGVYLFLQYFITNPQHRRAGWLLLIAGAISPLSRGPWIGVVVVLIVFLATGRNAISSIGKTLFLGCLAFSVIAVLPGGEKATDLLPFIGKTEKSNIDYRDKLIDNSLIVIKRNLLFGSINYREAPEMREMDEGLFGVDIVNSYIGIALDHGIVGLGLFVAFFLTVLMQLLRSVRRRNDPDDEASRLGRSLLATLVGILFIIITVSSISVIPIIYWAIGGVGIAYVQAARKGLVEESEA